MYLARVRDALARACRHIYSPVLFIFALIYTLLLLHALISTNEKLLSEGRALQPILK